MLQRGLRDPFEDRRGDRSAEIGPILRCVDDDEDRVRRSPRRDEADKRCVVVCIGLPVVHDLLGGARLTGGLVVREFSLAGSASVGHDAFHDRGEDG